MKKDLELRRLEWRDKDDPQRVVVATLAWSPADRANGYPARCCATLCNVRREGYWETGNPHETECITLVSIPTGSRRCKLWDGNALARFAALIADYLPEYASRYSLTIDVDAPSTTR